MQNEMSRRNGRSSREKREYEIEKEKQSCTEIMVLNSFKMSLETKILRRRNRQELVKYKMKSEFIAIESVYAKEKNVNSKLTSYWFKNFRKLYSEK